MINVDFLALLNDKLSVSGYDLRLEKFYNKIVNDPDSLKQNVKLFNICYEN